jgi:hypothetical protein
MTAELNPILTRHLNTFVEWKFTSTGIKHRLTLARVSQLLSPNLEVNHLDYEINQINQNGRPLIIESLPPLTVTCRDCYSLKICGA